MSGRLAALDRTADRASPWLLAGLGGVGLLLALGVPAPVALLAWALATAIAFVAPPVALGACLVATPFIFKPVEIGGGSYSLLELALVATAAGLGGRIAVEALRGHSIAPLVAVLPSRAVTIGALILIALAFLSLTRLADPEHRDASMRAVRTVVIGPLVIVPATVWSLHRRRIDPALIGLAAMVFVCAAWGAAEIATGRGVAADGVRRATGPYSHPNNLAFFLERATLLTAIPALLTPRLRRAGLVLLAVGIGGVLLTFSRGALLGLPAGLAVALWLTGRLRAIAAVVGLAVALVGGLAIFAGERLFDLGGDGSEPSRVTIWDGAGRILRDFPVSGIGPDQFYVMYGLRYIEPEGWPERYTSHPHNLFLDFWLSLGLGGLVFVIVALVWIGWWLMKLRASLRGSAAENEPVDRAYRTGLAIAGAAALTAGLVHGLVDNAFFLPDLAVLTWFSVVLFTGKEAGE